MAFFPNPGELAEQVSAQRRAACDTVCLSGCPQSRRACGAGVLLAHGVRRGVFFSGSFGVGSRHALRARTPAPQAHSALGRKASNESLRHAPRGALCGLVAEHCTDTCSVTSLENWWRMCDVGPSRSLHRAPLPRTSVPLGGCPVGERHVFPNSIRWLDTLRTPLLESEISRERVAYVARRCRLRERSPRGLQPGYSG